MARQADALCAGGCGKLLWGSRTSLPAGQRKCRECRRKAKLGRHCATCGSPLSARGKIYCSRTCANRGKPGRRGKPPVPLRTCEICGEQFKRKRSDREGYTQRTCSRACGVALRQTVTLTLAERKPVASRVYIRDCAWCGVLFAARKSNHTTCSPVCGRKLGWEKSNQERRVRHHICPCGAVIPSRRAKCDACLAATRRERRRRERARKRESIASEPYTLAEIAERDGYRCGLCRKRVPMTKDVPHPKAPTIDHIVPWSISKDDTRANVQLAHFLCNALKRDRGTSWQPLLIG